MTLPKRYYRAVRSDDHPAIETGNKYPGNVRSKTFHSEKEALNFIVDCAMMKEDGRWVKKTLGYLGKVYVTETNWEEVCVPAQDAATTAY